jgi:hypothetical protein
MQLAPGNSGGSVGAVQSRPLPAPGPGQVNQPPSQPQPQPQPRANVDPVAPLGDEVVSEPSAQKIANTAGVFSGLDKITGRITSFDATVGETVQFGALQITPRACYTRPPTETANTDAFVEVNEITLQGEVRRIFNGWMFAASPGLNALEHPIYDVWLTSCKGPRVAAVVPPPDTPPVTPRPPVQRQPQPPRRPPPQQQPAPPPPPQFSPFGR